ncbi:hypothetical protein J6590_028117 [Homalodisca vitripennis]|nr:hypothetical protein J6590_028117 [Homalodisca vitripennis]
MTSVLRPLIDLSPPPTGHRASPSGNPPELPKRIREVYEHIFRHVLPSGRPGSGCSKEGLAYVLGLWPCLQPKVGKRLSACLLSQRLIVLACVSPRTHGLHVPVRPPPTHTSPHASGRPATFNLARHRSAMSNSDRSINNRSAGIMSLRPWTSLYQYNGGTARTSVSRTRYCANGDRRTEAISVSNGDSSIDNRFVGIM